VLKRGRRVDLIYGRGDGRGGNEAGLSDAKFQKSLDWEGAKGRDYLTSRASTEQNHPVGKTLRRELIWGAGSEKLAGRYFI